MYKTRTGRTYSGRQAAKQIRLVYFRSLAGGGVLILQRCGNLRRTERNCKRGLWRGGDNMVKNYIFTPEIIQELQRLLLSDKRVQLDFNKRDNILKISECTPKKVKIVKL
mgnify:FL=1